MKSLLDQFRSGLIVSCQAKPGSALDNPAAIATLAQVAKDNGAVAVRIQGVDNIKAVRARVSLPVIGLIKRTYEGFEPYITPTRSEVAAIIEAGAAIVAFDATERARPNGERVATLIDAIRRGGAIAMADCARLAEGQHARALGAEIVATTLCGYTKETAGTALPALDLVGGLRAGGGFVICEGGIHTPQAGRAAVEAGADAIVVGTAITNVDWLVSQYAAALLERT
ncbi:MAG: N-acetylmannosamine-6-phosphate 2-epimerase [Candidatus Eremiobacteraeota bacterium]|nr:N-acetylmannosamine-6-phosphate 2-epimerase [Candidatus Eremiobacteraeota bacterium]